MNYSIVYSSFTGNTAMLAEALRSYLPKDLCTYYGPPKPEALQAPLLLIGFWTDKGNCDQLTMNFLSQLTNQQVVLFGTAGFGGSPEYFRNILDRVKHLIPPHIQVLASFMCQGKMPDTVKKRYETMMGRSGSQDSQVQKLLDNFQEASHHPDPQDLQALMQAIAPVRKLLLV